MTTPRPLLPTIVLRRHEERRLQRGHLWVYSNEVDTQTTPLKGFAPGDPVTVLAQGGQPLGSGYVNPHSLICARLISYRRDVVLDRRLLAARLGAALALREQLYDRPCYRLVHGEGDGLPGLVVDRYGDVLSAEAFSLGMYQRAAAILERLAPLCGTRHTLIQPGPQALAHEGFSSEPVASPDLRPSVTIQEFGTRFRVHFAEGHKTGFFCDQRDNRRQLATFCRDRSVLDLCCYTGGFAVQAKKMGGAAEVIGVDLDEGPLKLARENADLNQCRIRFVQADVFPFMRDMLRGGRQFDVVVLDPPKLIRSRAEIEEGTRKHFDLNRLAMQLVRPGGLLLSCTCAGLLPEAEFRKLLYAAARQAGDPLPGQAGEELPRRGPRPMQVLARSGAAADHPIASNCPETEYLNAAWLRLG